MLRLSRLPIPMGTSFFTIAAFALLSGCASVGDSKPVSNTASAPQTISTDAGYSYLYSPMPDADRTAVAITWHSDLTNVPVGQEALPRLGINLMLNGGAGGLPAEEIIADFEDLDSGSDLWVQPEEISGFILSPKEHMSKASEIANLVLTKPNLEQKWFDREKKILVDDASERESKAGGLAWNLFREVALGDHPYKRFWSLQPLADIENIKLDDVKAWHADAFSNKALTITAAGHADVAEISNAIDRVLVDMPSIDREPAKSFSGPEISDRTILLHKPDVEKSVILIVGKLPDHSEALNVPIQLGVGVLGWGKQSRLFTAVRTELGAAYGFGAGTWDMTRQHRVLHISGEIETEQVQQVFDAVEISYNKFRADGINLLEFPIAKKFYVQRLNEEMDKPESVAYLMMEGNLNGFGNSYMPNLINQVKSQKRSEVNQTIEQNFPEFESMLKIIVTPDPDAIEGACVITEFDQWQSCG